MFEKLLDMMPARIENITIPISIHTTAMMRPIGVIGTISPYPTVVTLTIDHHIASSMPSRYFFGN